MAHADDTSGAAFNYTLLLLRQAGTGCSRVTGRDLPVTINVDPKESAGDNHLDSEAASSSVHNCDVAYKTAAALKENNFGTLFVPPAGCGLAAGPGFDPETASVESTSVAIAAMGFDLLEGVFGGSPAFPNFIDLQINKDYLEIIWTLIDDDVINEGVFYETFVEKLYSLKKNESEQTRSHHDVMHYSHEGQLGGAKPSVA